MTADKHARLYIQKTREMQTLGKREIDYKTVTFIHEQIFFHCSIYWQFYKSSWHLIDPTAQKVTVQPHQPRTKMLQT